MHWGGMPIINLDDDDVKNRTILRGVYDSILNNDVRPRVEVEQGILENLTSFCIVTNVDWFKRDGKELHGKKYEDFVGAVGNKTVHGEDELKRSFAQRNVCTITLLYNGYFGKGNNVNFAWLKSNGLFDGHLHMILLNPEQVRAILTKGGINEGFAFIDKPGTR